MEIGRCTSRGPSMLILAICKSTFTPQDFVGWISQNGYSSTLIKIDSQNLGMSLTWVLGLWLGGSPAELWHTPIWNRDESSGVCLSLSKNVQIGTILTPIISMEVCNNFLKKTENLKMFNFYFKNYSIQSVFTFEEVFFLLFKFPLLNFSWDSIPTSNSSTDKQDRFALSFRLYLWLCVLCCIHGTYIAILDNFV